jgi:hypothetical protein
VKPSGAYYVPFVYGIVRDLVALPHAGVIGFTQLLYALPAAAALATLARRARGPLPDAVWCHSALLVASAANLWPRTDWGHLVFVLPFAIVQVLLLVARSAGRARPGRAARFLHALPVAVAVACAGAALILGPTLHAVAGPPSFGPRVRLRPVSPAYRGPNYPLAIEWLREHTEPGEAIFVPRAEPLLYFATDTRNPTPYPGVVPGFRAEQEDVILRALEGVRFVVMSEIDQPLYTYYRDELPRVQDHFERHFHLVPAFENLETSELVVLERGADRGPAALDLVRLAGQGRRFLRDESGTERPVRDAPPVLKSRHNRRPLVLMLGAQGGGIDFDLELPPGAHLETDFGLAVMIGNAPFLHPERVTLEVAVRRDGERFERLARFRLPPAKQRSTWTEARADLSAWGGERITLRLELVPSTAVEHWRRLAWLGSPHIVTSVGEGPAPGAGEASR